MRLIYDIFFIIFSLIYIPYLLISRKLHRDFPQKFGFLAEDVTSLDQPIWIHAVSVGEAAVAARLAEELKKHYPSIPIAVSTTTMTGNDMISKLGEGIVDSIFYYPVDISFVVSRVVRKLSPRAYVMVETELWPNLLAELAKSNVPVIMANGRISDNSFKNYRKIGAITKKIMSYIDTFCMQSEKDAEKITALGALKDRVMVSGNMKFDMSVTGPAKFTRAQLGIPEASDVLIAGSTHFPEEQMIIDMFCSIRQDVPDLKFILAPRHVERSDAIKIYLDKSKLKCRRLSEIFSSLQDKTVQDYDVLLVDTIGHIKDIYSMASVIFVGGSLVKKGGQNPIEGAVWGKPILFGPYMDNFREIADIFKEGGAAFKAADIMELEYKVRELLMNKEICSNMGIAAAGIIEKNTGALGRTLDVIEGYVRGQSSVNGDRGR